MRRPVVKIQFCRPHAPLEAQAHLRLSALRLFHDLLHAEYILSRFHHSRTLRITPYTNDGLFHYKITDYSFNRYRIAAHTLDYRRRYDAHSLAQTRQEDTATSNP